MFASLLTLCLTGLLLIARCFGRIIKLRRLSWFGAHGLFYASNSCTISIEKISIQLHLPRPQAPYWAVIIGENYEYEDGSCHASFDRLQAKLWFFPTHFRFSGGPWIDATMEGFAVDVRSSKDAPWWINSLRSNLVTTVLNCETILLHAINTKLYFGTITKSPQGDGGGVDKQGLNEGEANDELRARCSISQWNIATPYGRMYSFGTLTAEFRRSWVEDTGTFAMVAEQCRWLKLRSTEVEEDRSIPWCVYHNNFELPQVNITQL